MPSCSFVLLQLVREAQNFHSVVVEGIWLCEVNDVESDFFALSSSTYSKEIPLRMAVGVDVVLQNQIVFVVIQLDS